MTKVETDELIVDVRNALDMLDAGINVHIPKRSAVMLFGAVIVANMVTTAIVLPLAKKGFDKFVKIEKKEQSVRG